MYVYTEIIINMAMVWGNSLSIFTEVLLRGVEHFSCQWSN